MSDSNNTRIKSKKIKKYLTGLIINVVKKYPKTLEYGLKIMPIIIGIIAFIFGIATIDSIWKRTDDTDKNKKSFKK